MPNFQRTGDISHARRRPVQANGKGPWFPAGYAGECDTSGDIFEEGDEIRADGQGGWEARECCDDE